MAFFVSLLAFFLLVKPKKLIGEQKGVIVTPECCCESIRVGNDLSIKISPNTNRFRLGS